MKKKNILLLRGLIRQGEHWGKFINDLQSLLPNYHITTLDLPGNGKHHKLRSFTSIRQNVQFLRDQWKKRIDYPSENILIAISVGGMVGMEWSMLYPEDWNKVILINTSHGALSPFYHRFQLKNIFRLLGYLLSTSQKRKQEMIYSLTVNDLHKKNKTIEDWIQIAKKHPVKFTNGLRQLWAAATFRKIAGQTSVPTYILCSKTDELVSYKCSEQIAKYWKCPITYHYTAGHDPSVEARDWLGEEIQQIINL